MPAAWSAWFPDLMPHLPGCPAPVVEHELKRAAQAFFAGSYSWRVMVPAVAVAADTEEVAVAADDPAQELVRVEQAWYDNKLLDAKTGEQMLDEFGDDWIGHTGTPVAYLQEIPGVLRLYPIPTDNAVTGLKCRISVRPSEAAADIPDALAMKYREQLTTGAKGRLMLYAGKPWTNVEMGAAFVGAFNAQIDSANAEAARAFGGGRVASRPRWC